MAHTQEAVPRPDDAPIVLDIEASGFGLGSYPIEIGFVDAAGQAWCSLVKPLAEWQHWDPNAAAVHHITREQLCQHGRDPEEIVQVLNDRLRGQIVYSDAWAHDYTWLNKLYEAANRSPTYKLENLRQLLSDSDAARWHDVKRRVALNLGIERHRASADARLLQNTLLALRQHQRAAA